MNSFGDLFKVTIYGESHGEAVGCIIDGMKPGVKVDLDLLRSDIQRRKSGALGTTPRIEADEPIIVSGVFNEYTTGAPINVMFKNTNTSSKDYSNLVKHPRPSHADYIANLKYNGFQDYRGGGHFSGRLTLGIVAAGSFAKMMLPLDIKSRIKQIGTLSGYPNEEEIDDYLKKIIEIKDSVGGIIEISVSNMIKCLGEPMFDTVESKIASILYAVPAVKAVEFGAGFEGINLLGSQFNDMIINGNGKTKTNNNGGINGGITNGNDLVLRVFVKPTPSIGAKMETFNFSSSCIEALEIKGRHDACIARRCGIVLENAIMIALADLYLIANRNK